MQKYWKPPPTLGGVNEHPQHQHRTLHPLIQRRRSTRRGDQCFGDPAGHACFAEGEKREGEILGISACG